MEKLNFHDSIRIYLPGLLLCFLAYAICSPNLDSIGSVVIPAVFAGIILEFLITPFSKKYFQRVAGTTLLIAGTQKLLIQPAIILVVGKQFEISNMTNEARKVRTYSVPTSSQMDYITTTLLSTLLYGDKLHLFRSPKSFGELCFSSSLICLFVGIIVLLDQALKIVPMNAITFGTSVNFVSILLFIGAFLFFVAADKYFKESLKRELFFWSFLSKEDLISFSQLMTMCEKLEIGGEQDENTQTKLE